MSNSLKKMMAICFAVAMVAGLATNMAFASKKSPYESGYDHGCDDAFISDSDDRYINQPGKGRDYHTNEFMSGYRTGFEACSDEESQEENSWVTPADIITHNQEQAQKQYNKCGNMVILATVKCSNEAGAGQQS